jgi:ABC-type multidrug transport system ATPase subunit
MQARLELQALTQEHGDFKAVRELSLSAGQGEVQALLGPNRTRKTTTLRMLMGLLQPTSRTVRVDALHCFGERVAVMQRTGYLPDKPFFYDYLQGSELVRFSGEMHGLHRTKVNRRAKPLMERQESGCTVLFSTHLLDLKEKLCTGIPIAHRGRLRAHGRLEKLRTHLSGDGNLEEVFFAMATSEPEPET